MKMNYTLAAAMILLPGAVALVCQYVPKKKVELMNVLSLPFIRLRVGTISYALLLAPCRLERRKSALRHFQQ